MGSSSPPSQVQPWAALRSRQDALVTALEGRSKWPMEASSAVERKPLPPFPLPPPWGVLFLLFFRGRPLGEGHLRPDSPYLFWNNREFTETRAQGQRAREADRPNRSSLYFNYSSTVTLA